MNSLRHRLLLWFLALSLLGWAVTMIVIWHQVSDEIEEIYDAHLVQTAKELAEMVPVLLKADIGSADDLPHLDRLLRELSHPTDTNAYAATLSARIWWHGIPLHSQNPLEPVPAAKTDPMVRIEDRDGQHLRRYVYFDAGPDVLVEVTELHTARSRIIDEFARAAILPLLALLPLLGLASWLTSSRGLKPLQNIVHGIRQRSPRDLQTLTLDNVPDEVRPLLQALNQLFERVQQAMEREQRFTGDASHELRTPLAALRIQAQLAQRTSDPAQREHALQQLLSGIDRSTHVVEQLLALAHMEPDQIHPDLHRLQLQPLLREQAEQLAPLARRKSILLHVGDQDVSIHADRNALMILLRNLIDNAIRYTRDGGEVSIACGVKNGNPVLEVGDSGPGIPPDQRKQVLERFHRGEDPQEPGCGLGLSIVQRVAEIHAAHLLLGQSSMGGLLVQVTFVQPDLVQ